MLVRWGGEYPLSPSQREAISCYKDIRDGEVLAVNGPPRTGKTTLLQTMVANMYVEAALKKGEAPVIIATSTNNQAVTNIMDSFGRINSIGIRNLEERWITGAKGFSVYFPSERRMDEAKNRGYQYTNLSGGAYMTEVETEKNKQRSRIRFQEQSHIFFGEEPQLDTDMSNYLHKKLVDVEHQRELCVNVIECLKSCITDSTVNGYIAQLEQKNEELREHTRKLEEDIHLIIDKISAALQRCRDWRDSYKKLPWYVRFLKMIPCFQKEIFRWSYEKMRDDELEFLERGMDITEIERIYYSKIDSLDEELKQLKYQKATVEDEVEECAGIIQHVEQLYEQSKKLFKEFLGYGVEFSPVIFSGEIDVEKLNNTLDKVRYLEFWLAVHYYEARWLEETYTRSEQQKKSTINGVMDAMYRRLAMLTPCMVMTCFMLPKQFYVYDNNSKSNYYMFEYADLLIVDEAGQISPEIGAPAFAFAKKAVVVGDEMQISPVWGTTRALDITLVLQSRVIYGVSGFSILEANGLNGSQSSVMKIASNICPFEKYGKGLFLSEHRRCYNEIARYCNILVYGGHLEPLRGCASQDEQNPLIGYLPPMGHKQIDSEHSYKTGTSRYNESEADAIVQRIGENFQIILERYRANNKQIGLKNLIGIITPFKSQALLIKTKMKEVLPKDYYENISVGTVHTFQGAERNIIVFSSVYGQQDGCYFINGNREFMNVAVSRAKDSFLVFGDSRCLVGEMDDPAYLLKQMTQTQI